LHITQDAVRKRIKRGYIEWERDDEGRLYVWVDPTETAKETSSETSKDVDDAVLLDYVETLKERVRHLEEESRRKDHLLAAALERIPAIKPPDTPSEARESPVTASEKPHSTDHAPPEPQNPSQRRERSWWRAFFGLELA